MKKYNKHDDYLLANIKTGKTCVVSGRRAAADAAKIMGIRKNYLYTLLEKGIATKAGWTIDEVVYV